MPQTSTAVVKQDEDSWIGWIEDIPGVNCQEASREALLESLRVTLAEAIEYNRAEARGVAGRGYEEFARDMKRPRSAPAARGEPLSVSSRGWRSFLVASHRHGQAPRGAAPQRNQQLSRAQDLS